MKYVKASGGEGPCMGNFSACSFTYPALGFTTGPTVLFAFRNWAHHISGGEALCRINEVTLWWAWLVLGWVTVYGQVNHLSMKPAS